MGRAGLGDPAPVDDEYLVGVDDRLEAVGDDDESAAPAEAVERGGEIELGPGVEGGGWLVEEDESGPSVEGAGDGDALALSA